MYGMEAPPKAHPAMLRSKRTCVRPKMNVSCVSTRRPSEVVIVSHLREWRIRAALTQQQLADRAGVDRRTVMAAEQGKTIRLTTWQRLATALHVGSKPTLLNKPPPE